jgi:predicted  nucleic acid-binding Zn-ribbon protein
METNTPNTTPTPTTSNNTMRNTFMALTGLLSASTGYLGYELYNTKTQVVTQTQIIQVKATEYDVAKKEIEDINTKFGELKTDNTELQTQLDAEKAHIVEVTEQLEKYKGDAAMVGKLRGELGTIRGLIKSYLKQIDELNTANKVLTEEKAQITTQLGNEKNVTAQLNKEKEELGAKVAIGARLKTTNMFAEGVKMKGEKFSNTTKSKRVDKIRLTCKIGENPIASKTQKTVYMVITGPDGSIFNNGYDHDEFKYKGQEMSYSAKKVIIYDGDAIEAEFFYTKVKDFDQGKYNIKLYCDDSILGETVLELK